jgi:hypothetical protein
MDDTPQQSPAGKKNWFARHKVLTALLVLFGVAAIAGANGGGNSNNAAQVSSPSPTGAVAAQAAKEPATPTPAAAKSYRQVFAFSGNGAKKSEPLKTTGDRFRVKYDCKGDLCQAFLYSSSSEVPKEVLMNAQGAVKDETVVYAQGNTTSRRTQSGHTPWSSKITSRARCMNG